MGVGREGRQQKVERGEIEIRDDGGREGGILERMKRGVEEKEREKKFEGGCN